MSVDKRRLAAAQRTAARTNPSRARRLGAWIIIVPALSLFSFSIVAGAAGFRGKPDVESAAARVVPKTTHEDRTNGNSGSQKGEDGGLVLVGSSNDGGGIGGLLGKGGREICWVSRSQLVRVSAVYRTSTATLQVGGKTYTLVTVYGANEKGLRQVLSSAVKCRLVQVEHLFFLPFDGNLS